MSLHLLAKVSLTPATHSTHTHTHPLFLNFTLSILHLILSFNLLLRIQRSRVIDRFIPLKDRKICVLRASTVNASDVWLILEMLHLLFTPPPFVLALCIKLVLGLFLDESQSSFAGIRPIWFCSDPTNLHAWFYF